MSESKSSRRDFIKKAGYVAPVVFTLGAKPSFASTGSSRCDSNQTCDTDHDMPDWLAELIRKIRALLGR
jgi:hypothetical protein